MPAHKHDWTREEPELLRRMKKRKFYTFRELFNLMYGEMVQYPNTEASKTFFLMYANHELRAIVAALVLEGKLETGSRNEEEPIYAEFEGKQIVTTNGERIPVAAETYMIHRKRSVSRLMHGG